MGRVIAPYGIKGWIKVQPFTQKPEGLLNYPVWNVGKNDQWQCIGVEQAKVHGAAVVAKLAAIADREQAAALRGKQVAVSRQDFPDISDSEYYWTDLVGLRVMNTAGESLGTVARMIETGANDVMVVAGDRERLLPFVETVVRHVDLKGGMITVDWDLDF